MILKWIIEIQKIIFITNWSKLSHRLHFWWWPTSSWYFLKWPKTCTYFSTIPIPCLLDVMTDIYQHAKRERLAIFRKCAKDSLFSPFGLILPKFSYFSPHFFTVGIQKSIPLICLIIFQDKTNNFLWCEKQKVWWWTNGRRLQWNQYVPQNLKSELAPGRFIISFRNRLMDFFYSYMSMVNDLAGGWGILMTSAYYPRVLLE